MKITLKDGKIIENVCGIYKMDEHRCFFEKPNGERITCGIDTIEKITE